MYPEKAEIIGLLCAEGTHYNYVTEYSEYDKRRGKYYEREKSVEAIEFGNNNSELLSYFRNLMDLVYSYSPEPQGNPSSRRITIKKKTVISDLLQYTFYGHDVWDVPGEVNNGDKETKAAFIRGFYEGDGIKPQFVNNSSWKIRVVSKNEDGLLEIQNLLHDLGISSNVHLEARRDEMYGLSFYGENSVKFIKTIRPKFKTAGVWCAGVLPEGSPKAEPG